MLSRGDRAFSTFLSGDFLGMIAWKTHLPRDMPNRVIYRYLFGSGFIREKQACQDR
jgi:hypothetical protein